MTSKPFSFKTPQTMTQIKRRAFPTFSASSRTRCVAQSPLRCKRQSNNISPRCGDPAMARETVKESRHREIVLRLK